MDLSVILTYRCDSRCSTCHVWQHPTLPAEEVAPAVLAKLPNGFGTLLLAGGEPTLRADLEEIVDLLRPKARRLVLSTNGLLADPLERIVAKHPDVRIRLSIDAIGAKNDVLRGEENGFARKIETWKRLRAAGGRDLGLAAAVQDANADQILDLFRLCRDFGGEMDVAALHNGFWFHKIDNESTNRLRIARALQPLLVEWLRSGGLRNGFRAHLHLGLMKKILGQPRRFPCPAGRASAVVDPWGRVYACPIRPDLEIGDLTVQTWKEIVRGPRAAEARTRVARCAHNCWTAASAAAALRRRRFAPVRGVRTLGWVLANRLRAAAGLPVDFDRAVDFADVAQSPIVPKRESWLGKPFQPTVQKKTERPYGAYNNAMNR